MSLTNFPNGITSFGAPVVGEIPAGGSVYFVDPTLGNDSNDGKSPTAAKKTLLAAYNLTVANKNDIVYFIGGATADVQAAAFNWAKNYTHLIGVCSPIRLSPRCRITQAAAGTISTLFTLSASGCVIKNIQVFSGSSADQDFVGVSVTGQRNYIEGCHFVGAGHATPAARAGAKSLYLNGGDENLFVNCTIGVDTINYSAASAVMVVDSAATRNKFENCEFRTFTDDASHVFVRASSAADIDRTLTFKNCLFFNAINSTSTTMTNAMEIHVSAGGTVVLDGSLLIGATDWNSTDTSNVYSNAPIAAAATAGFSIAVTRS